MDKKASPSASLKQVVSHFGTQDACAEALGVRQPTISRWLASGRIAHDKVLKAEELTGVSRHDLRPDIYPRETMVDRHVSTRFQGVDRMVGLRREVPAGI